MRCRPQAGLAAGRRLFDQIEGAKERVTVMLAVADAVEARLSFVVTQATASSSMMQESGALLRNKKSPDLSEPDHT
jgi:hypothetical protein